MFLYKLQNYFIKSNKKCLKCGTYNLSYAKFCKNCGLNFTTKCNNINNSNISAKKSIDNDDNIKSNNTYICQSCGIDNPIIASFCKNCGSKLNILNNFNTEIKSINDNFDKVKLIEDNNFIPTIYQKCNKCQTDNIKNAIYCKNCGSKFKQQNEFTNVNNIISSSIISSTNLLIFILIILLFFSTYLNFNAYRSAFNNTITSSIPESIIKSKNLIVGINIVDLNRNILIRGTGFIIGKNGYIATNYHIVENFYSSPNNSIEANIDGKIYKNGIILCADQIKDLAIIKVDFISQFKLILNNSYSFKQGENIYVIGNPHGFETTISNGIISAINRGKNNYIQITAPISSGSSGSPVFNSNGEVIGIATLSFKDGQNLNFAIPINLLIDLLSNNEIKISDLDLPNDSLSNIFYLKAYDYFSQAAEGKGIDGGKFYFQKAKYFYLKSIALNNKNISAYLDLSALYSAKDFDFKSAKFYLDRALSINPNDYRIYKYYGALYIIIDDAETALSYIEKSIKMNSNDYESHYYKAQILAKLNLFDDAIQECNKVIKLNGRGVKSYVLLGRVYSLKQDYINSTKYFEIALKIDPNCADAHFGLACIYIIKKDKNSVLQKIEIIKKLNKEIYSIYITVLEEAIKNI